MIALPSMPPVVAQAFVEGVTSYFQQPRDELALGPYVSRAAFVLENCLTYRFQAKPPGTDRGEWKSSLTLFHDSLLGLMAKKERDEHRKFANALLDPLFRPEVSDGMLGTEDFEEVLGFLCQSVAARYALGLSVLHGDEWFVFLSGLRFDRLKQAAGALAIFGETKLSETLVARMPGLMVREPDWRETLTAEAVRLSEKKKWRSAEILLFSTLPQKPESDFRLMWAVPIYVYLDKHTRPSLPPAAGLQKTLETFKRCPNSKLRRDWLLLFGNLLLQRGRWDLAVGFFQEAVRAQNGLRGVLKDPPEGRQELLACVNFLFETEKIDVERLKGRPKTP